MIELQVQASQHPATAAINSLLLPQASAEDAVGKEFKQIVDAKMADIQIPATFASTDVLLANYDVENVVPFNQKQQTASDVLADIREASALAVSPRQAPDKIRLPEVSEEQSINALVSSMMPINHDQPVARTINETPKEVYVVAENVANEQLSRESVNLEQVVSELPSDSELGDQVIVRAKQPDAKIHAANTVSVEAIAVNSAAEITDLQAPEEFADSLVRETSPVVLLSPEVVADETVQTQSLLQPQLNPSQSVTHIEPLSLDKERLNEVLAARQEHALLLPEDASEQTLEIVHSAATQAVILPQNVTTQAQPAASQIQVAAPIPLVATSVAQEQTQKEGFLQQQAEANRVLFAEATDFHSTNDEASEFNHLLSAGTSSNGNNTQQSSLLTHTLNLRQPQWTQDMGHRIQMMMNKAMDSLEIRLDPAGLGAMKIRLSLDAEKQTHIVLSATSHITREMLDNAIPRLKEMLSQQGVDLASVTVRDEGTEQDRRQNEPTKQAEDLLLDVEESLNEEAALVIKQGLVDHYV